MTSAYRSRRGHLDDILELAHEIFGRRQLASETSDMGKQLAEFGAPLELRRRGVNLDA
jgi:hypothetical protein